VIDEVGCPPARLELDPSSPVQVELVDGVFAVGVLNLRVEVFELLAEKSNLPGDLAVRR
jgi:hypothetical protein